MTDLNKLMKIYSNDISLLGALQELSQRRESELRPATKFLDNEIVKQMNHIESEFSEVKIEFYIMIDYRYETNERKKAIENLISELVDLQMSCETMLAVMGLDRQQRMESRRKVIEKNAKRGYYEPQQGSK